MSTELPFAEGRFAKILTRSGSQIRKDRAISIVEAAELKLRRKIEDLELSIKDRERTIEQMMDLSPTRAGDLTLAADFKAEKFIEDIIALKLDIRVISIEVEACKSLYTELFTAKSE